MTEAICADNYLQTYLDEITKKYSKHYVQTIIERILNCKPVYALNKYSRELLALAMEKRMVKSIETSSETMSFWNNIKINCPLLYHSKLDLSNYSDLYVKSHNKIMPETDTVKEIEVFYNDAMHIASRLLRNKTINDRYISDIIIDINQGLPAPEKNVLLKLKELIAKNRGAILSITSLSFMISLSLHSSMTRVNNRSETTNGSHIESADDIKLEDEEYNTVTLTPSVSYSTQESIVVSSVTFNSESTTASVEQTYTMHEQEEVDEELELKRRVYEMATENPELGFVLTFDNLKYDLSEEDKKLLTAIVAAESDGTYDDSLAVASSILNRCEDEAWQNEFGDTPIDQVTGSGQYSVYSSGAYLTYMENPPEIVSLAVNDCLNGVRNNEYLSFLSNGSTSGGRQMISPTGNRYR